MGTASECNDFGICFLACVCTFDVGKEGRGLRFVLMA